MQLSQRRRTLSGMFSRRLRLRTLRLPLRWVLALVLILNGAVVPPVMAHAAMQDDHGVAAHTMSMHCHPHDGALPSSESTKHHGKSCACCMNGGACQCGFVVTLALPITFADLRPLAPLTISDQLRVPQFVAVPRHRLLRPPIA